MITKTEISTDTLTGRVVSRKMSKTIVVVVESKNRHPIYGKYVSKRKKIFAHDETNQCQEGDIVEIKSCRPLSKKKAWMLVRIVGNGG